VTDYTDLGFEDQLKALAGREAFALAQGREDLLDIIDAERRQLETTHAEQEAMQRGGNTIAESA